MKRQNTTSFEFSRWSVYALLFAYVGVSLLYQVVSSASFFSAYFDERHQVQEPFQLDSVTDSVISPTAAAQRSGLSAGDRFESINGTRYQGAAQWQLTQAHAHPGEVVRLDVRRADGTHAVLSISFEARSHQIRIGEAIFLVFIQVAVPLFCLVLGYWVALARPLDPNAWFVLLLLSYPEAFISVPTSQWWPGLWLVLRLYWHLLLEILAPVALLWLGLLFPERSRIDIRMPWLKWCILALVACGLTVEFVIEYGEWYDHNLLANRAQIDAVVTTILKWAMTFCLLFYWIALFGKLRTALSSDARRRLRVLCTGSVIGLGSMLVIFGGLPWLGIADPGSIRWLDFLAAILMLTFPLSLAYVVIVQRAMDVRILVRIGSKYLLARTTLTILRIAGIVALIWFIAIPLLSHRHSLYTTLVWSAVLVAFAFLFFNKKSPSDLVSQWIDRKFFREAYDAEITLANLAKTARTISDPTALVQTVSRQIADVLHVDQIAVLLRRDGIFEPVYTIGQPSFGNECLRILDNSNSSIPVFNSAHDEQIPDSDTPELLLPLPGRTQLLGAMALGPKRSEAPYTPSDLRLLESVGVQTGLGLELSETAVSLAQAAIERASAAREMEIAREVQERLFPQQFPSIPGVTLAGTCRTVFGVGGDYYDAFDTGDDRLGLAIGDVSGKGISAALLMSSLRACLRTLTLNASGDLTVLMRNMNRLIYEASAVNRYATFFLGIYDPSTRRLQYVNAGHNPPAVIRSSADGSYQHLRLETGGPVVGLLPDVCYEEASLLLHPGDVLLAYTDGISEAMTDDDEEWGDEAMILAAQYAASKTAEDIVKAIFEAADAFTEKAPQHDDMTLLVMKLSPLP